MNLYFEIIVQNKRIRLNYPFLWVLEFLSQPSFFQSTFPLAFQACFQWTLCSPWQEKHTMIFNYTLQRSAQTHNNEFQMEPDRPLWEITATMQSINNNTSPVTEADQLKYQNRKRPKTFSFLFHLHETLNHITKPVSRWKENINVSEKVSVGPCW